VAKKVLRVVVIVLAVIFAGILTLAGLGFREGGHTIRSSLEIGRPADQVWPWLEDPEKLKVWVSGLLDVQPKGVGRQLWIMEERNDHDAKMEVWREVSAEEKPRRKVFRVDSPGDFNGEITYTLTPFGKSRTKLEQAATYQFDHWFAKLMTPVVLFMAQRKLDDDLVQLKAELEKGG
jgi:uncharacterized protein YndB with AHSA1/START domain